MRLGSLCSGMLAPSGVVVALVEVAQVANLNYRTNAWNDRDLSVALDKLAESGAEQTGEER